MFYDRISSRDVYHILHTGLACIESHCNTLGSGQTTLNIIICTFSDYFFRTALLCCGVWIVAMRNKCQCHVLPIVLESKKCKLLVLRLALRQGMCLHARANPWQPPKPYKCTSLDAQCFELYLLLIRNWLTDRRIRRAWTWQNDGRRNGRVRGVSKDASQPPASRMCKKWGNKLWDFYKA